MAERTEHYEIEEYCEAPAGGKTLSWWRLCDRFRQEVNAVEMLAERRLQGRCVRLVRVTREVVEEGDV